MIVLSVFLSAPVYADVAKALIEGALFGGGDGGKGGKRHVYGVMRFTAGYIESHIDTFGTSMIKDYDKAQGGFGEIDLGVLIMLHFGYSVVKDNVSTANFNNAGFKDSEVSLTKYQWGGKLVLPVPWVNPWIGGGILQGSVKLRDETGSAKSSNENMRGYYWHTGVDLLLLPYMGIRLAYQQDTVKTNKYDALGQDEIKIDQGTGQAGLMLYF